MKMKKVAGYAVWILPIVTGFICLGIGRYQLSIQETLQVLLSPLTGVRVPPVDVSVIFNVRLPRIILALCVGSGLAVSGAAFQSMFSNALATPDTLGVASGASFGAALALLFGGNLIVVQICALVTGLAALGITYSISRVKGKGNSVIVIVLSGMVISSLFQALVSFVKYVADAQDALPAITYWLMGSMASATYAKLLLGLPFIVVGTIILIFLRWRLNIIALSDDEARSLGGNVKLVRLLVMLASTMITASAVSMCGQVGWVGLLVPHVVRLIYGSDSVKVIPMSVCFGACFMVVIDTIARSAIASEIPLSILTALIGAPIFVVLLRRTGGARL